jgi:hypothetical protein
MQAHAEHKCGARGLVSIGFGHGLLELDGGIQRIDSTGELDQSSVAGQLDQAARVACQRWLEVPLAVLPQARQCAALVPAHQPGVADHIHRHDGNQSTPLSGQ